MPAYFWCRLPVPDQLHIGFQPAPAIKNRFTAPKQPRVDASVGQDGPRWAGARARAREKGTDKWGKTHKGARQGQEQGQEQEREQGAESKKQEVGSRKQEARIRNQQARAWHRYFHVLSISLIRGVPPNLITTQTRARRAAQMPKDTFNTDIIIRYARQE